MNRMNIALTEAKKAFIKGEVPIGAAIFKGNTLIAKAYNKIEYKKSALSHAELIAINNASKKLNNWRLSGTTLLVTLEPCTMCMGAIINSRIDTLIFAAYDYKNGAISLGVKIPKSLKIIGGVEEMYAKTLLQRFFKTLRTIKRGKI